MGEKVWSGNRVRKLVVELSASNPVINRGFNNPERTPRYDMHYGLEFGIVCSGKMRRYYPEHTMSIGPGEVWFCGMWEPHGWEIAEQPCHAFVLVIWPPILANYHMSEAPDIDWLAPFTCDPKQRPQTPEKYLQSIVSLAGNIQNTFGSSEPLPRVRLRLLLMEALSLLLEDWESPKVHKPAEVSDGASIDKALQLVFSSTHWLTAQEASRACGLDRNSFGRKFKRLMGIRFPEFVLRHKLASAVDDLRYSDLPIKAVAMQWGFTDTSHMHRHIVKRYGCTPAEMRQKWQAD